MEEGIGRILVSKEEGSKSGEFRIEPYISPPGAWCAAQIVLFRFGIPKNKDPNLEAG